MAFCCISMFLSTQSFAQCDGATIDFNEDDFNLLTIKADEANPNPAPVTSNCIDIWDLANAAPGADGIGDVEITLSAAVFNPNANGTCDDGEFLVSGAIGGGPLPCPGPSGTSDFGGSTSDDCVCESGYTCFTYTFKNGFSSTAEYLNAAVTSSNGSTEGHESMVGWVTAGTDASGAPLGGLPTVNLAAMATYCTADYNGGVSTSTQVGATGAGTFAVDQPTGITNDCATSGQNGEDTESGDNPGDNTNAQAENPNWGLATTDIITEFTVCWIFTTAPGTDCDGDGDTGVGTNPSGSIGNIDVCPPVACEYTADIAATEDCGEFTIDLTNIAFSGTATGTYDIDVNGTTTVTAGTGATQTLGPFPADGATAYTVVIYESGDMTCMVELMITAPSGTLPPVLTVTCPQPIDICSGTTVPLTLTDSTGGATAVYGGTCAAYINDNGTTTNVSDDFIDPAGASIGSCDLTVQLVDANGCDSGTPETCTISFISTCDADGGAFPSGG